MPCFSRIGPNWGPHGGWRYGPGAWHGPGRGFHALDRRGWIEHLERHTQELKAELAAVEEEIRELTLGKDH